jgi:3-oxoacyl-[acyl-carrier protein] reductase
MIEIPTPPPARGILTGKRAVITAAAGTGIGYAIAERFALEGAAVVLSDRHERRLAESTERLAAEVSTPVHGVVCDVTNGDQVDALYAQSAELMGGIDIGVNNAGLGGDTHLSDMEDDEWHRVLDVTLTSSMRCTRSLLRHFADQKSGVIVNNASVTAWRAQAGQSHYAAAKAGVMALTRCAADEAAEHNVRINAIAPTITAHANLIRASSEEVLAGQIAMQPQGRAAEPWEMANVVLFLASDLSSYLTGEVISASAQHS